jgi:hypothetical protein
MMDGWMDGWMDDGISSKFLLGPVHYPMILPLKNSVATVQIKKAQ